MAPVRGRRTLTLPTGTEDLLRDLAPRVLATLVRRYGDFDAADDAVQEAMVAAARRWPRQGIPEKPQAWLLQSATRRMIDQWRSDRSRRAREEVALRGEPVPVEVPAEDDTLALLVMCCHPSLTPASAIPLTLRAVGGLTTAEIARAFLVPEPTMGQRISRAKGRIRSSGARFALPGADDLAERLRSVLRVLYLIFNEGYASSVGPDLHRVDLSEEAIRLARMLRQARPDDSEVSGLLALMLLVDARRPARTTVAGDIVPLPEQDRSLWDRDRITEGLALVAEATRNGRSGEYVLQAAIAAVHDQASAAHATDWPQILALYGLLEELTNSPVVRLNRAVAAAMVHGPVAGLQMLEALDGSLADHYRLDSVRAHLLEMDGQPEAAAEMYVRAAVRATNLAERRYLTAQAARLHDASRSA